MANEAEIMRPVVAFYDAMARQDLDAMVEQVADACEFVDVPGGIVVRDQAGMRRYFQGWMQAFPDGHGEILNSLVAGDQIAIEVRGRGTHAGPFETPEGTIPPTNRSIEIRFGQIFRVREGKIVSGRSYYDLLGVLRAMEREEPSLTAA